MEAHHHGRLRHDGPISTSPPCLDTSWEMQKVVVALLLGYRHLMLDWWLGL